MGGGAKRRAHASASAVYETDLGEMLNVSIEEALEVEPLQGVAGEVDLIFTSPPFPLVRKKKYGNHEGDEYLKWMAGLAPKLGDILAPTGSIVIEIGNAWEPGEPVMSTLPVETLLQFKNSGGFKVCQQFIGHNPARLPGPAQWVNIERIRVKDSFTYIWWMSRTGRPKANNRNVLIDYGDDMKRLIKRGKYNAGERPSGHNISEVSFLQDNGGAIPPSVLEYSNTGNRDAYHEYCRRLGVKPHPARMSPKIAEFFVNLLTEPGDLVVDPFAGSNTTGMVAESLGRRWISIEAKDDYARASKGRFPTLWQDPR